MTKRAYVKALVGDLRRYLQWQQAEGVPGSSPASDANRAAFEAFKQGRQERQLAKMRANLSGGSGSSTTSSAPKTPERAAPSSPRPAPPESSAPAQAASPSERFASSQPASPQSPTSSAPKPHETKNADAKSSAAPLWAQMGARHTPSSLAAPSSGKTETGGAQPTSPTSSKGQGAPTSQKSQPSQNAPEQNHQKSSAPRVSNNDEPPPYDDYDGPMYDEALGYEDYSHEELLSSPPPQAASNKPASNKPAATKPRTPQEKMDFLKNYLGDCQRCTLCKARTQVVIGEGNPSARLMFISDAPGAAEDKAGRPFAGASGELLTKMIKGMGLTRDQVYIASVVKCRPPGDRRPTAPEVAECLPFLQKQIEVVQPEVIVTLGGFTALALLGDAARKQGARGSWQTHEGIALMPTYHPDDLLRDESKKHPAWEDLKLVIKRLGLNRK